jgi:hypothetical protein
MYILKYEHWEHLTINSLGEFILVMNAQNLSVELVVDSLIK